MTSKDGVAAASKAALKIVPPIDPIDGADAGATFGAAVRAADGDPASEVDALSPEERSREILRLILSELDDDKAEEIVTIDLDGKSNIADAMVVASGRSQRHVVAMSDKIQRRLKEAGFGRCSVEGAGAGDWVLIDAGDVIAHLFRPEVRKFYNLERVWSEAAHAPVDAEA